MVNITKFRVRKTVDEIEGLSPQTRAFLYEYDPIIVQTLKTLPDYVIESNSNEESNNHKALKTAEVDLGWKRIGSGFKDWKRSKAKLYTRKVSKNFTCVMVNEDDFFGKQTSLFYTLQNIAAGSRLLFPLVDTFQFPPVEVYPKIMEELRFVPGKAFPDSYNTRDGFDLQSDDSLTQLFFYGIAAPLVAAQKHTSKSPYGPFEVDMPLHNLKVRKGFRPYGARIHFNEHQHVTAIYDYANAKLLKPGDKDWDAVKYLAKTTAITLITVREHLTWTHLILSNTMARDMIVELPPSHAIRRLLTIFTYRSTEINTGAFSLLVPKRSLLHRATAFEFDALNELFDQSYLQSTIFKPFNQIVFNSALTNISDNGQFPYIKEGREYYNIVRSFVMKWLKKAGDEATDEYAMNFYNAVYESSKGQAYEVPSYSTEFDMINLLSQMIFTVTAYHELVGGVVDYNLLPNRANARLVDGKTQSDLQSFLAQGLVTASTSVRMPKLMKSYSNFFGEGGAPEWERDLWGKFMNKLEKQSQAVKLADQSRPWEFKNFDPENFECSVSV